MSAAVLNLCVMTHIGVELPFHRVAHQILTLQFIRVANLQSGSITEISVWLGSPLYEELHERVAALERSNTTCLVSHTCSH